MSLADSDIGPTKIQNRRLFCAEGAVLKVPEGLKNNPSGTCVLFCAASIRPDHARRLVGKDVKNPCISVCKFSDDVCVGCGRSKDEVRQWKKMKNSERKTTVRMAEQRLKGLKKTKKNK